MASRPPTLPTALVAAVLSIAAPAVAGETDPPPARFNSAYNFVKVEKTQDIVTFLYMHNGSRMSAVDLANPTAQVVPYSRYLFAAELFQSDPKNVLMAGLGAGAFNRLFGAMYPGAVLTTVEIDEMILQLAERYAGYSASDTDKVVIADARMFIRRSRETYDWIVLDAFDIQAQIPVHLMTREFFTLAANRLADDGVLAINLHQGTQLFQSQIFTMRSVFPVVYVAPVLLKSNVVVFAMKKALPLTSSRRAAAFKAFDVDLSEVARRMIAEEDYVPFFRKQAKLLTDDYAPVEFLNMQQADELSVPAPAK